MINNTKKILFGLLIIAVIVTVIDLFRIFSYDIHPSIPLNSYTTYEDEIYSELVKGNNDVDWNKLIPTLKFIDNQYDTSDFKLVNLIRILYEFSDNIPVHTKDKIDSTLLNFRYWMDEPGENGMCYWSENHQILFSSAEYLIGNFYKDKVFNNSGLYGYEHSIKAKQRILDWLELRWLYGFTEFYSGVYYIENVAALLNLIDHSDDEEIVVKSKIILDLIFYDIASQSYNGMTVSVSGRAYESNRKGGRHETMGGISEYLLFDKQLSSNMVFALGNSTSYCIPSIFNQIVNDSSDVVIKQSNGLNLEELKYENLYGTDDRSILMQWGMEAFTNASVINNSISYIRKNRMFSNEFLKDFRYLDFSLLNLLSLHSPISKFIKPSTDGKVIERGNTYTYRTKDYSIYSVQNYNPGEYADQHHVAGMNIGNKFSIFHTHPARKYEDDSHSPNFFVGYGRLPHVVQDYNVSLSIYNIPSIPGFMEEYILDYTYVYFPINKFDSVYINSNYIFGKSGNVYCALIGSSDLSIESDEIIIQEGRNNIWIIEAGSFEKDGSFENFINRIDSNILKFDKKNLILTYHSNQNNYRLEFGKNSFINGEIINTEYPRYDSPYINADRKSEQFLFKYKNETLLLDFYNCERVFYN